ncbi:cation/H(+) antiporter 15-like [Argentina anserina]|uniref:cation/H(+) antiporter 15-like n=1 Tax=Argentina anserina TaxID=57926 RepID=UPI0021766DE1|nr:cation/H(+) antiporter 15-like [Potentilla anserina]
MTILSYNITYRSKTSFNVCYNSTRKHNAGLWNARNTLDSPIPMLIIQLLSILVLSRVLAYLLKPLRQPRIVTNILAGVLLGPSVFSITSIMGVTITPFDTIMTLETFANLGLVFHVFLIGLDFEIRPVVRAGTKAISIAVAGLVFAIPTGWVLHTYVLFKDFETVRDKSNLKNASYGPIFWGIILASTNFSDLTQILADFKLLHSEVGRLAISGAIISDVALWNVFLVVMAILADGKLYTVLLTLGFMAFCVLLLRPALAWAMRYTTKDDSFSDVQICCILFGIVFCGLITDACGGHSIVGPFMLGAVMPKGMHFKQIFKDRAGKFVDNIFMPLFYLVIGGRFNSVWLFGDLDPQMKTESNVPQLVGVIILALGAKSVGTFIAALFHKMTPRDGLVLGILMNTKGLLALIILTSSRDLKVCDYLLIESDMHQALDNQTYGVMLVAVWAMTVPVGPFLALICKSSKSSAYKPRSIQSAGAESELRILACTHTTSKASGIISLIEASNPSRKSPINVLAVKLVELTDHNAAMLIVHDACNKAGADGNNKLQYDFSSNAFEFYASQRENVSVQSLTAVSAYATMHQDICNMADENDVNFIIIPFRMKTTIDGVPDDRYDPLLSEISQKVMENARCTVGLFVDCGLVTSRITNMRNASLESYNYAMLFIGGPDDREALAYAWRMAGHPRVNLTVIRFTPSKEAQEESNHGDKEYKADENTCRKQRQLDDSCIDDFKLKSMNEPSVALCEKHANNLEEIISIVSTMDGQYQLYIAGRGHDGCSPITPPLFENNKNNKLGTWGETLASSSFLGSTSLLIIQQGAYMDELIELRVGSLGRHLRETTWQSPVEDTEDSLLKTSRQ